MKNLDNFNLLATQVPPFPLFVFFDTTSCELARSVGRLPCSFFYSQAVCLQVPLALHAQLIHRLELIAVMLEPPNRPA